MGFQMVPRQIQAYRCYTRVLMWEVEDSRPHSTLPKDLPILPSMAEATQDAPEKQRGGACLPQNLTGFA